MPDTAFSPGRHGSYTVAFICALNLEMSAVRYLLDREHPNLPPQEGDPNLYILGELCGHNVVLAWLSGNQGKGAAAIVATNLSRSFPAVKWRFMVGIGGGVPSEKHDIRLGDVVISMPEGHHGGVVQYDLGKDEEEDFKLKGLLLPLPTQLRNAVELMRSNHMISDNKIEEFLQEMLQKGSGLSVYKRPPSGADVLFAFDYRHETNHATCEGCDKEMIVHRRPRSFDRPYIHYGLVASGDRVMKSGVKRQATVQNVGDILCFEMEAAGIATEYPCIVIRGISDYADSHKNDGWHYYAAATAAATAKELLSCVPGGYETGECEKDARPHGRSVNELSNNCIDPEFLRQSQDCSKSLSFEEMNDRLNDINITAYEGTCRWLLQHPVCEEWSTQDRALLWIKGKPGSGKSTLLRYFLGLVQKGLQAENKAFILSFFIHGRGVELQKTPLGLFRSLLYQLLSQIPDAEPGIVEIFHKRQETVGVPGKNWHWSLRELQDAFRAALANILRRQTVWLFVDALDECGKRNAIELVRHFKSLLASIPANESQLLICFTCRHYPILDLGITYEITLENENGGDLSAYVQDRLSSLDPAAASLLVHLITTQADGVFMWASLQVDKALDLEFEGASLSKIEKAIRSTPPDLHSLYLGLVQSISEKETSRKLLEWICFATRPLSVQELQWVLAIDADHDSNTTSLKQVRNCEEFIEDAVKLERRLKTLSCGLVEAISSSEKTIVQFIHQSVRDFFVERGITALNDGVARLPNDVDSMIGMAHHQISRVCIRYCLMDEIIRSTADHSSLISEFPLIHYATTSWIWHAKESEMRKIPQEDILIYFKWPSNTLLRAWLRACSQFERFSDDSADELTDILHVLSQNQLMSPLRLILEGANHHEVNINVRDSLGRTPLLWAALKGNMLVVQLLLSNDKVDLNARDASGRTPLFWAAANHHQAVFELLLQQEAIDTNARSVFGWNPLLWAAEKGDSATVRALLALADVNIDIQDAEGRTPFSYAAGAGNLVIARLLIEHGANISTPDRNGWTPLHIAARKGNTELVNILIDRNVDIDASNSSLFTPLCLAIQYGNYEAEKLLRGRGATLGDRANNFILFDTVLRTNRVDLILPILDELDNGIGAIEGKLLLFLAVIHKASPFVRRILQRGVGTESRAKDRQLESDLQSTFAHSRAMEMLITNTDGLKWRLEDASTALHVASQFSSVEIARMLLEFGFDIEAKTKNNWTPLHFASWTWNTGIVWLLCGNGADFDSKTSDGITSLMLAAENGHADLVQLFLESGADIEAADDYNETALLKASRKNHVDVIQLLVEDGANVAARGDDGATALHHAASNSNEGTIMALLRHGANIHARDGQGKTPLHCAISWTREEHLLILLEMGADVEAKDINGRTALHRASSIGALRHIKILLAYGANIDATDNKKRTPLHLPSQTIDKIVVKLLLEKGANIEAKDEDEETPLHYSSRCNRRGVILPLIQKGANIEARNNIGQTPLHVACLCGHMGSAEVLLENGADTEAMDINGDKPLDLAVRSNAPYIVQSFADHGVRLDSLLAKEGGTPSPWLYDTRRRRWLRPLLMDAAHATQEEKNPELFFAAQTCDGALVRVLIAQDEEIEGHHQNWSTTPLHVAARFGREEAVRMLLARGSCVGLVDEIGCTPLDWAIRNGHEEVAELLRNDGYEAAVELLSGIE